MQRREVRSGGPHVVRAPFPLGLIDLDHRGSDAAQQGMNVQFGVFAR